jgi:hypothetical protein
MGRPSKFTKLIADAILESLREGTPLAEVCRTPGFPHPSTWREWCDKDEALAIAYARAREDGFDVIAQECLEIADETSRDTIRTEGGERANAEWISRSKLRVETRLKLLAKWDPKRYGEKVTQEHTGPDGGAIKSETVTMTAEEAYKRMLGG